MNTDVQTLAARAYAQPQGMTYDIGEHTIHAVVDAGTNEIAWSLNGCPCTADFLRGWLIRVTGGAPRTRLNYDDGTRTPGVDPVKPLTLHPLPVQGATRT